ncbi:threonine synthase [Secundilactobacillus collinoides]|uniref:Threonine synthase n=2 Tax=Secundilactobacillus collinoides TaxID=33960 RepID=A0A0R2BNG5_SECCO|nr:threonine synthase [Secundilactobacillus collinoides]KRM77643.1 threonine synthase [Secundilactobacillus collinoides DSM 20515 = JCM 1123]KZL43101.1 threonine synthase [Secundilactobacillus collinoides]
MTLLYRSTRGKADNALTASAAILQGLSPDGGLYVPTEKPQLDLNLNDLPGLTYQQVAFNVLSAFLTDFNAEELKACVNAAYDDKFDDAAIAPVSHHGKDFYLELFHGPTIAFKDLALSILPHLMTTAAKKQHFDKQIVILTATSGDTGKAAMAGFADVADTQIIVFYPKQGVSAIQKQQMITQPGANTHVVAIDGNFDQAQTNVKEIFNDDAFKQEIAAKGYQFSSANSINIGRLVPQVAYYFYAYGQLIKQNAIKAGDKINFTVPTGNFGDILAGYYAKELGLPINRLICASNQNNVLTDFFETGYYDRVRPFFTTTSPSMDILVSSNLERLIFRAVGSDATQTSAYMHELESAGHYQVKPETLAFLKETFSAGSATGDADAQAIASVFKEDGFAIDPHTAVAKAVADQYRDATGDDTPMVIVSTASPYKFPNAVLSAIEGHDESADGLDAIAQLKDTINVPLPPTIQKLFDAPVRHNLAVNANEMKEAISKILKIG